ncbi:MAG: M48 family metalloprotease [Gemmatimonadota bacterium]
MNPVTGDRELSLVSEQQEIQMGREADAQIVPSLGLVEDSGWQDYVQRLGEQLAAGSERPNLPWTFRVVDDPVINAFALPGGFVYVTRGIVNHFTSEAQIVAVLGHEIGHVTARHGVNQMSRQQLAQLGLGLGTVLAPELADWAGAAQAGLGLLFLSYGRDDERQADDLGLRYMSREGFQPRAMAETFQMLATASGGQAGSVPNFLSTHPDPLSRRDRVLDQIRTQNIPGDRIGRDPYLERLGGMIYGTDPRQGYFEDNLFLHPELAFRFRFPAGWQTVNQRQAVQGISPEQDALIALTLSEASSAQAGRDEFLAQQGVSGSRLQGTSVNGIPAAGAQFTATTEQGTLVGRALFLEHRGNVYQILGYAPESRWNARADAVQSALGSFDEVTDRAVLGAQPDRIALVRLPSAMTLEEFDRRYPSVVSMEALSAINQVDRSETIPGGTLVKRVVSGN